MPQGRRKTPFSGKAKKLQLQAKKQGKGTPAILTSTVKNDDVTGHQIVKINAQPSRNKGSKGSRYALQFYRETNEEIQQKKEAAHQAISPVEEKKREISEEFFAEDTDFPKRPAWNYDMSPHELEVKEQKYFTEYVSDLERKYHKNLSYFELNLETWRQFWRVIEMSDIILAIVDIRFAASMFPSSLYTYIVDILKKDIILVLNKIDLASPSLVLAWKHYFKEKFPHMHILMFTSFPGYNLRGNPHKKSGLQISRLKGRLKMAAEGAQKLLDICQEIVKDRVDLSSWHNKIMEEMKQEFENDGPEVQETISVKKVDTAFVEHEKFQNGILTIGCIGQPNVGKSSLLNALMGKKVVSVSRTPGHTKHFQTIFLTPQVKLCDCPGLVFPSQVPRTLQVLMGSFPIAQLRDPYSSVKFLAERLNLPQMLSLQHPEGEEEWSAIEICEAWALKRGFHTARAARLDTYRAANHLLRMCLEGKICLCLYPPSYLDNKEQWESHKDIQTVKWIQACTWDQPSDGDGSDVSEDEAICQPACSKGKTEKREGNAGTSGGGGGVDSDDDNNENDDDDDDDADDDADDYCTENCDGTIDSGDEDNDSDQAGSCLIPQGNKFSVLCSDE